MIYKGQRISVVSGFSMATPETRDEWSNVFQIGREKLFPVKNDIPPQSQWIPY